MKFTLLMLLLSFSIGASADHRDDFYAFKVAKLDKFELRRELVKQAGLITFSCSSSAVLVAAAAVVDLLPGVGIIPDLLADGFTVDRSYNMYRHDFEGAILGSVLAAGADMIAMSFDFLGGWKLDDDIYEEYYEEVFQFARSSHLSTIGLSKDVLGENSPCQSALRRLVITKARLKNIYGENDAFSPNRFKPQ